jgi:serine/threonine protein phosphatase 1
MRFTQAPADMPPGQRIYAVGDIHGCATRLRELHALIAADLAARPIAAPLLLHLGDYIDRGPDSAEVVTLLAAGPPIPGLACVNLTGNHEQMLLTAISTQDPDDIDLWLSNGGVDALESWDIGPDTPPDSWAPVITERKLEFLRELPLMHRAGGYLFVHAGIRPGVPWDMQDRRDLLWIREPFLTTDDDLGVVVVHGHTPVPAPLVRLNRIDIDTGAYLGGELTCAVLEADRIGFLQA